MTGFEDFAKHIKLPNPLALVFSGGLARTTAQIGMVSPLEDAGISPNLVVGSSAGAVNAAVYAADPHDFEESAVALWSAVSSDRSLVSIKRSTFRGLATSQAARTKTMLRKHLERVFGNLTFDDLSVPLIVTATELESGRAVSLSEGNVVDALLATTAFPVVMPPSELADGQLVVDGSMVAGIPILQATAAGARAAIVLDAGSSVVSESAVQDAGWFQIMALSVTHMLRSQARHDVGVAAKEIPVITISSGGGNPFGLATALDSVPIGNAAAQRTLSNLTLQAAGFASRRRLLRPGYYGDELISD